MRLVIDASTVVGESLRVRGRQFLSLPSLHLFIAREAWDEAHYELEKRVSSMIFHRQLIDSNGFVLRDLAFKAIRENVLLFDDSTYQDRLEEATLRIPADRNDAPSLALALALECGILTEDRDFFGCGVPVWSAAILNSYLSFAAQRVTEPESGTQEDVR